MNDMAQREARALMVDRIQAALSETVDLEELVGFRTPMSEPDESRKPLQWIAKGALGDTTLDELRELATELTGSHAHTEARINARTGTRYLRRWTIKGGTANAASNVHIDVVNDDEPARFHIEERASATVVLEGHLTEEWDDGTATLGPGTLCLQPARLKRRRRLQEGTEVAVLLIATGLRNELRK